MVGFQLSTFANVFYNRNVFNFFYKVNTVKKW